MSAFYLYVVAMVALLLGAILTHIARRRGRDAPWNLPLSYEPPQFADARLNKIEAILVVIAMPIGILLAVVGAAMIIFLDHMSAGFALACLGLGFLLVRGLFLAFCLAFADLADEAPQVSSS